MDDPELCRCGAEAAWLGDDVEVILTRDDLILRDRAKGARVVIPLGRITAVDRNGPTLRLRAPSPGLIEFAGIGFDGWYPLGIPDPETEFLLLSRLNAALAAWLPLRDGSRRGRMAPLRSFRQRS